MSDAWDAQWGDPPALWNHYTKHRNDVGASTPEEYDASARTTIRNGIRFEYRERNGVQRVGYYDKPRGLFTALDRSERRITTHCAVTEHYIRGLLNRGLSR